MAIGVSMYQVKVYVGVVSVMISAAYLFPWLQTPILIILAIVTGITFAIESKWAELTKDSCGNRIRTFSRSPGQSLQRELLKKRLNNCFSDRLLISKNVDPVIEQLIENLISDYIMSWYLNLVDQDVNDDADLCDGQKVDHLNLSLRLKNETWIIVSRFLSRIRSINEIDFFTKDLVNILSFHVKSINECINPNVSSSSFYPEDGIRSSFQKLAPKFQLFNHLQNEEKEIQFLTKISNLLINILIPKTYLNISPLKHLLIEVITNSLASTINLLSDPDYLNTKIVELIRINEEKSGKNGKISQKYAFTETYDEFIELIKKTSDANELKRIKYFIVTEIMQATAINNLKRERQLTQRSLSATSGHGHESKSSSSVKGDHLLSRNLPRYINQLRYAKRLVEKQLNANETLNDMSNLPSSKLSKDTPTVTKTIISFSIIMSRDESRKYLYNFLKDTLSLKSNLNAEKSAHYLILYYESVNEMKLISTSNVKQIEIAHQLLTFNYYLTSINLHIKLPKEILKDMESFIMGNMSTPIAFYQTQKVVYKILEDRYYPAFIVSKEYDDMLIKCGNDFKSDAETRRDRTATRGAKDAHLKSTISDALLINLNESDESSSSASASSLAPVIDEHIKYSSESLSNLKSSYLIKMDALSALRHAAENSSKPTAATAKRINKLASEISDIKENIHEVDCHIQRSKLWTSYLGQWRSELYSIQDADTDTSASHTDANIGTGTDAMCAIIVHLGSLASDMRCDAWVIARTLSEIVTLKRKLTKYRSSLRRLEIQRLKAFHRSVSREASASMSASVFEEEEDANMRKVKASINQLFNEILLDEDLFKTEEVFLFFLSSPSYLRTPINILKNPELLSRSKSRLPFASWLGFGSSGNDSNNHLLDARDNVLNRQLSLSDANLNSDRDKDKDRDKISTDEELSKYFDELLDAKTLSKDDIAEPAYNLLNEIFELNSERGSLSWLRKSMIAFVQISFGSTINRQIHEYASYLISESMICYYLTNFRDTFWPPKDGSSASGHGHGVDKDMDIDCGAESIKTMDDETFKDEIILKSEEEKRKTYLDAKSKIMNNIPDFLINLLGESTTKKGTLKFFEMVQFKECNKQLIYNILQVFIFKFVPELEKFER